MIDRSTAQGNGAYGAVATGAQAFMIVMQFRSWCTMAPAWHNYQVQRSPRPATITINFNTPNTSGTITSNVPQ